MIREAIDTLINNRSLSIEESMKVMNEIMEGECTPVQLSALLTALRMKGETPEEIAGLAIVMREKSIKVSINESTVDTCGTGGDGKGTFNISTASAFVASGAGIKVAKHGNRAASGSCGSADVLEALGIKIDLDHNHVKDCINEIGMGFMFAPKFHPAMRHAAPVRKEIGTRTVFNILGPLTNPATTLNQLIGVADYSLGYKLAQVLQILGSNHCLVVHGNDGIDELTLGDINHIWELKDNTINSYTMDPKTLGLPHVPISSIPGGTAEENSDIIKHVLSGKDSEYRDVVLLNSAATLLIGGKVETINEGVVLAAQVIDSGKALLKLKTLVEFSQNVFND